MGFRRPDPVAKVKRIVRTGKSRSCVSFVMALQFSCDLENVMRYSYLYLYEI